MVTPRDRRLFVEGGGDGNSSLSAECRKGFSKLFERAGVRAKPRIVACGGRKSAFDQFARAHEEDEVDAWLLVDAEACVDAGPPFDPWAHVKARPGDGWDRPDGATDDQLQFMNVVMETWLVADPAALKKVFGPKVEERRLPAAGVAEAKDKAAIYAALAAATKPTPSGGYRKGAHSFRVLANVDPEKLRRLSWADRFLTEMGAAPPPSK